MSRLQRITSDSGPWPLHDAQASRKIEALAATGLAPHTLMQRAGLAVARLAAAVAPHARRIWIAAGPGNNGGDGFEAAHHLQRAGWQVRVTALGDATRRPADAAASLARAQAAGVMIESSLPAGLTCDIAIDALLGLGRMRSEGAIADALRLFNGHGGPRLAVDLPSGLDADHGHGMGEIAARASDTLSLLTLKPGLFTAQGRDTAGAVWFDDLGCSNIAGHVPPHAWLGGADAALQVRVPRCQARHKGSFGDVLVVGGASAMTGAALLAGRAALAAGAGRVYVSAIDKAAPGLDLLWPELMFRPGFWREPSAALASGTVVCGCGGGDAIREALPTLLTRAARLVLDADALNAIAADSALQALLTARTGRGQASVLTPHPLEAARLAGAASAAMVQADRLRYAEQLATRFGCVVLLKGSGSVIAAPQQPTLINASGNARLASAGTGDVLAGWLGGLWAAAQAQCVIPEPQRVAAAAAWLHGKAAEGGDERGPLTASRLLEGLMRAD
ncbi:MAG: NAD(P)H-hydrate dehydratase [Burkholderiaceae bacterium]|nr:NAD(P)H-hydrate dehydratase [Burkholderiaceae bacterium]